MWPDMLTKITETTYSGSYASAYSLNNVSSTGTNALASRLFGGNYNVVDLKENAIVNVGLNQEANTSNASTRSTSSTTSTLYTIGSDAIGNITNVGNVTLDWNGRRLESISQAGTELVSYEYNMDGQRTKKIVTDPTTGTTTTTEYFYNGSILAGQKTGNDEIVFMYDNNGDVFGFEYNGTPYYYVKNAQNDVYLILDENGYAQVLYQYDAWGNVTSCYDVTDFGLAGKNPIMYRSYYVDLEMGMFIYYLNSRYYVAEWGRFASADSVVAGVGEDMLGYNLFAYCFNNPVNMSDENGNWPKWATKVLIGVAVIAAAAVVTVATGGAATGTLVAAVHCVAVGALKGAVVGAVVGAVSGAVTGAVSHRAKTGSWKGAGKTALESGATGFMTGAITGAITGGKNSNVCFVAGTSVLTSVGLVAIENISSGDFVWAENPETREKELKRVVQTFVNETNELVHVYVNDEEIVATPEHPFYVPQRGWTSAIELRAGDILVLQNGKYVVVEKIQHEILEKPVTVYNFEVEDFHTYYIGNSSVLVHNDCGPKLQATYDTRKQAFNAAKREIGVPRSQQPIVRPNIGNRGELNPGRVYDFGNGKFIRDDIVGHVFNDGSSIGRHFNTSTGLHLFY